MNSRSKIIIYIGFRVVILCLIGMFHTFVPEHLTEFFGDYINTGKPFFTGGSYIETGELVWGSRHYWYFAMTTILFILSVVDLAISVVHKIDPDIKG